MWTELLDICHVRMHMSAHAELSEVFVHTSSTVVSLLQHPIRWRIVETWALHVRCSCRLTAIRLVHTKWSIQWHYPLFTPASWYQAHFFAYFPLLRKEGGITCEFSMLCAVCAPLNLLNQLTKTHANVVPTPCHYAPPKWHTHLFPTISDDTAAMWTCQMGVSVQVLQGSCIMDGNRYSERVFFHPEGHSVAKHCVTAGEIWYTHRSHKHTDHTNTHTHTYPLCTMYCLYVNNYRHNYNPELHFTPKRLNIYQIRP
jgi:hypothetical protein